MADEFPIAEPVGREAFLYMEPTEGSGEENFAQCGPCRMFVPAKALGKLAEGGSGRCILHGSRVAIDEDDSCGWFAPWPTGEVDAGVVNGHATELKKGIPGSVTPWESGLVDRQVRCMNCGFFNDDDSECGLYEFLDRIAPQVFNLGKDVQRHACCNANTARR